MNGAFRKGDLVWYTEGGYDKDKDYRICPGIYIENCRVLGASGYIKDLYRLHSIHSTVAEAEEHVDIPF